MASKTISLSLEAYTKLKNARKYAHESFSQVVLRATWPEETITAKEFLKILESEPPLFSDKELDTIEYLKAGDIPPFNKWKNH